MRFETIHLGVPGPPGPVGPPGPQGDGHVTADADSITAAPYKHIMRRALGSTDCPVVEAVVPEQSAFNAATLKIALEEFGHLDAGPFGAVYDMGHVAPDMFSTPVVRLEGNGSQTFNMQQAIYTNTAEQILPTSSMFLFEGSVSDNGTAGAVVNYGGEAHVNGVRILGPGTATPGAQRVMYPVVGRYLNRLYVEGVEISNCQRGNLITATAVRYGGKLNGNWLHDCIYDYLLPGATNPEMWGISIDDNKPVNDSALIPDKYIAWSDGFEIASNLIENLTAVNLPEPAMPVGKPPWELGMTPALQSDGINLQMLTRNHRIHDNRIRRVGDALDGGAWNSVIANNLISDTVVGLKLLYGMNNTLVDGNLMSDLLLLGISLSGSGFDGIPTQDNYIVGNKVARVNMRDISATTAAFHLGYVAVLPGPPPTPGTINGYVRNTFVQDNVFDPQGLAHTIWVIGESDSLNLINNNEIVRGSAIPYQNSAASSSLLQTHYRYKPPEVTFTTYVQAQLAADQDNITGLTGTGTPVGPIGGWTEVEDRASNFNPTTGIITLTEAGQYEYSVLVTFKNIDITNHTGVSVFLVTKNASAVVLKRWTFGGGDMVPDSFGRLAVSGTVSDKIVTASLPVTVEIQVLVTGTSNTVGLLSNTGGFHFSDLIIKKV